MSRNLDVDTYCNGDPIPEVSDPTAWSKLTTGAWCYHNNNPSNEIIYGKLYNWYAVNDPRGLAPIGWHVASDDDWKELEVCLGMSQVEADQASSWRGTKEGGKLKSTGTIGAGDGLWFSPNTGATNESGFSALPGGSRDYYGTFTTMGSLGYWWSSTEYDTSFVWSRFLYYYSANIGRTSTNKGIGYSVRCVKD
jgi:uncharacterized protein (TIGR02145 family)